MYVGIYTEYLNVLPSKFTLLASFFPLCWMIKVLCVLCIDLLFNIGPDKQEYSLCIHKVVILSPPGKQVCQEQEESKI